MIANKKKQIFRELECVKYGSTKFSNYSKRDIDDLITNIEIEIRKNVIKKIADILEKKYFKKVMIQYMWGKHGKN